MIRFIVSFIRSFRASFAESYQKARYPERDDILRIGLQIGERTRRDRRVH